MELLLERHGCRLRATPADGGTGSWLQDVIAPQLTCWKREYVAGYRDRSRGRRTAATTRSTPVALYYWDDGRFGFPVGLYARFRRQADADGVRLAFVDRTPPPARPDALRFRPEAVARSRFRYRGGLEGRQAAAIANLTPLIAARLPGIVDASYGFGKTALIVALALGYPEATIAVVNANRDVIDRTYDDLRAHLPAAEVGVAHSGRTRRIGRVTAYAAGSLGHCEVDPAAGRYPDLLIVDEVQQMASDDRRAAAWRAGHYAAIVGLTGTPVGRADGTDLAIEALAGPVVYRTTYPEAVAEGYVVPIEVRMIRQRYADPVPPPDDEADDVDHTAAVFRYGIWRNRRRNRDFAAVFARHLAAGDQVLALVGRTEHALHLRAALREWNRDAELATASIDERSRPAWERMGLLGPDEGPLRGAARKALADRFAAGESRAVISTDIFRTGVSFDRLGVLIWAGAGGAAIPASQGPGRVSRVVAGKSCGLVYDASDEFNETARGWAIRRRRIYRQPKHDWRVTDVEPEADDDAGGAVPGGSVRAGAP